MADSLNCSVPAVSRLSEVSIDVFHFSPRRTFLEYIVDPRKSISFLFSTFPGCVHSRLPRSVFDTSLQWSGRSFQSRHSAQTGLGGVSNCMETTKRKHTCETALPNTSYTKVLSTSHTHNLSTACHTSAQNHNMVFPSVSVSSMTEHEIKARLTEAAFGRLSVNSRGKSKRTIYSTTSEDNLQMQLNELNRIELK